MLSAIRKFSEGEYSIEEIDALTGPLTGRPKSATFRTADVVGLDVMHHVISNLHDAVPEDESVEAFQVPEVLGNSSRVAGSERKRGLDSTRRRAKSFSVLIH